VTGGPIPSSRIGHLIWHFTSDDKMAIQHMPTTEQGEHPDFHGPGNRHSIGIEKEENHECIMLDG